MNQAALPGKARRMQSGRQSSRPAYALATIAMPFLLFGCGSGAHQERETVELPKVTVQAVTAEQVTWPSVYEAIGSVQARTSSTLSAKVMGYIREIKADVGDRVRAGQPLVILDSRDLDVAYRQAETGLAEARTAIAEVENAIAAAKAQMDLAEATFRRMEDLHGKNSITEQEFDEASAKLRMARANHDMAVSKRSQLAEKIRQAEQGVESAGVMKSYAEIAAPFEGVVTNRAAESGVLAAPGAPLLTIEKAGAYRFEARLEESWLPRIRVGQEVAIDLDALGQTINARVSEIVPEVDTASRAFRIRINMPNVANLRAGLFGRARFEAASEEVIAVPKGAVVTHGQVRSVLVVEDGRAWGRLVTLGGERDEHVAVLSGLRGGERIIHPVPPGLRDGSPVEVRP